jgi:hypothetical protein
MLSGAPLSSDSGFLPLVDFANQLEGEVMKTRSGWQRVKPVVFKEICWPVKIRVRAAPPLWAPRTPPVFPASLFFLHKPLSLRRVVVVPAPGAQEQILDRLDWRVLGEQDQRTEE